MLASTLLTLASATLAVAQLQATQLKIQSTNYCMDVRDGIAAVGTNVQIWECYGGPYQSWIVEFPTRVLDKGELLGESQFSRIRWAGSKVDMQNSGLCLGFKTKGDAPVSEANPDDLWITDLVLVDCARHGASWFLHLQQKFCAYHKNRKDAYCMQLDGPARNGVKVLVVSPSWDGMAARWVS